MTPVQHSALHTLDSSSVSTILPLSNSLIPPLLPSLWFSETHLGLWYGEGRITTCSFIFPVSRDVSTVEIKLDVLISGRGLTPEDLPRLFAWMWTLRTLTTHQILLLGSERLYWKSIWKILDYILYPGHRSKNRFNWRFIDPPVPSVVPPSRSTHCLHRAVKGVTSSPLFCSKTTSSVGDKILHRRLWRDSRRLMEYMSR